MQNGPDKPGRRQTGRRGEAPVRREKGAKPLLPTAFGQTRFTSSTGNTGELPLVQRLKRFLGLNRLWLLGAEQTLEKGCLAGLLHFGLRSG